MDSRNKRKQDSLTMSIPSCAWNVYISALAAKGAEQSGFRKQERSRRRQQEILRAALRVFARDGISRARIGTIAAEAGMPESSIYDYFASKEMLAYAVPREHLARFFAEYASASADATTFRERLRLYLWLAADFVRRNPEWARTLYLEIWPSVLIGETSLRYCIDDYARTIVELIRGGEANGEWTTQSDIYELAAILNGSVNQVIIVWLIHRKPRDLMKAISSVIDQVLRLLQPMQEESCPSASRTAPRTNTARKKCSTASVSSID